MDWLEDLLRREEQLKRRIAGLAASGNLLGSPPAPEGHFHELVRPAIEEIQAVLEDYLCGRNEEERAWMSYEVRLNLPAFSHLRNLYCLTSTAEA